MRPAPPAVIVMAKAPVAGLAKTRLIPALGAEGAAALARRLLAHAVATACDAGLGPVTLCATPDPGHPAFAALAARHPLRLERQVEGDLGARMAAAFAHALAVGSAPGADPSTATALMIGTDAPALDAAMLRAAAAALGDDADAVFVPALDGGYALIGLRASRGDVLTRPFEAMPWSAPGLMAATRQRLAAAGWRVVELSPVADMDEPADLVHLPPAMLAGLAMALPSRSGP